MSFRGPPTSTRTAPVDSTPSHPDPEDSCGHPTLSKPPSCHRSVGRPVSVRSHPLRLTFCLSSPSSSWSDLLREPSRVLISDPTLSPIPVPKVYVRRGLRRPLFVIQRRDRVGVLWTWDFESPLETVPRGSVRTLSTPEPCPPSPGSPSHPNERPSRRLSPAEPRIRHVPEWRLVNPPTHGRPFFGNKNSGGVSFVHDARRTNTGEVLLQL